MINFSSVPASSPTPTGSVRAVRHVRGSVLCVLLLLGGACTRTVVSSAPTPVSVPPVASPVARGTPPSGAPGIARAPSALKPGTRETAQPNWHRLDLEKDGVLGVGSERALTELLAGRAPSRRVIVAVIDGGVDTAHTLLASNLWHNRGDASANALDDDRNGFVDDGLGWNFAGGKDGKDVQYDTFEMTRLYSACKGYPAGSGTPKPDAVYCSSIAADYGRKKTEIAATLAQIVNLGGAFDRASGVLREGMKTETLTADKVRAYAPSTSSAQEAKRVWLQLAENGLSEKDLKEARTAYESQFKYALDSMYNPRTIVGDATGPLPRGYGNRDVMGPDALHGTHVSGIIGARRDKGGDVMGIAPDVSIMAIRAVPDGDERDNDIANAIRYAADNGANIINMSFGKPYSPRKASVDSAVRYVESKGVLMIHAAGNDGQNNDIRASFPTPVLADGPRANAWLEVGASSWKGGSEIPATFSNFGHDQVDVFAPGVDILSTLPNGEQGTESGTSMAAPVVSGVAALLMSYFPTMSALEIKALLLESSRNLSDVQVDGPGDSGRVRFGALSRTGGVVDAYAAVKLALSRERPKQP